MPGFKLRIVPPQRLCFHRQEKVRTIYLRNARILLVGLKMEPEELQACSVSGLLRGVVSDVRFCHKVGGCGDQEMAYVLSKS